MKKAYVLVNQALKPLLIQTRQYAYKKLKEDQSMKLFEFTNQSLAQEFFDKVQSNTDQVGLECLIEEYEINTIMESYRNQIYGRKSNENHSGVSLVLEKKKEFYILQEPDSYPKIQFFQRLAEKHKTPQTKMSFFTDEEMALEYLRNTVTELRQKKNGSNNLNQVSDQKQALFSKYQALFNWYYEEPKIKGQINGPFTVKTACIKFRGHHSAMCAIIYRGEKEIDHMKCYTGGQYELTLEYLTILYTLRFCLNNNYLNPLFHISNKTAFQVVNLQQTTTVGKIQYYVDAIQDYKAAVQANFQYDEQENIECKQRAIISVNRMINRIKAKQP